MTFVGKNENAAMSPILPAYSPCECERCACAASSISLTLYFLHIFLIIAKLGDIIPPICTIITADISSFL